MSQQPVRAQTTAAGVDAGGASLGGATVTRAPVLDGTVSRPSSSSVNLEPRSHQPSAAEAENGKLTSLPPRSTSLPEFNPSLFSNTTTGAGVTRSGDTGGFGPSGERFGSDPRLTAVQVHFRTNREMR